MLIPDFYTIKEYQHDENNINAQIVLNPDHDVYKGHFPQQAVVPGVIQLQMIKELLEKATTRKLLIDQMDFAKFLNAILPTNNLSLNFDIKYHDADDHLNISATIKDEKLVYTKVKGRLSFNT